APRADRRAVELEDRDDDEHTRVGGATLGAPEEEEEERDAERPRDVEARQDGQAEKSPERGSGRGGGDERAGVPPQRLAERDAAQVDEPVARRDEERQVVHAVAIDAPEDRGR